MIKSELEFRVVSEKAIDAIITIDDEFSIIFVNRATELTFGYQKDEILNNSILKLFSFENHSFLLIALSNIKGIKDSFAGSRFEVSGLTKQHQEIPLEVSLSINEYDHYNTYTAIIRDVSSRKKLEKQLKLYTENLEKLVELRTKEIYEQNITLDNANQQLKHLDQLKSNFLSNVSHELRTPLTSIKSSAKIILKYGQKNPDAIEKFASIIVEETERLTRLINNVLDLSKIEAGEMVYDKKSENFYQLIFHIYSLVFSILQEKGLKFLITIPQSIPNIMIDKDSIIQVFVNIINNAVKFTPTGFIKIVVTSSKTVKKLKISIIDTGVGISKDSFDEIFEKFKQTGDTLTDKPKGTGLGLPICREIIQHHGGLIWVESTLGKGSVFHFTLPIDEKEQDNFIQEEKKQILLLSNSSKNYSEFERFLLISGFKLITINHPHVLKNILNKYDFYVILIDDFEFDKESVKSYIISKNSIPSVYYIKDGIERFKQLLDNKRNSI
ncbi:PAS domain S-box protein [bacterium]|nr:PAS domain S-box protein [bacterium]